MLAPEAVLKYDRRTVAFDIGKLASSVARAACSASVAVSAETARKFGQDCARDVALTLMKRNQFTADSVDIRATVMQLLRDLKRDTIAEAYSEYARLGASLLWAVRVIEPGTPYTSSAGSPWDRRRLLYSLVGSGLARDPAGEVAREVERRIVKLGQDRVSPSLIHSITCLVLPQRNIDARAYASRRVAFPAIVNRLHFTSEASIENPLPAAGPALSAFWLQAVHSHEVSRAAGENLISLEPCPSDVQNDAGFAPPLDPLLAVTEAAVQLWPETGDAVLALRADSPDRVGIVARIVAGFPALRAASRVQIFLKWSPRKRALNAGRAAPISINAAGLMLREALRDPERVTVRLTQLAALAAQAHREREEYFNFSPVRGRALPVCAAGIWHAARWLQGEAFDAPGASRSARVQARTLIGVVRSAIETLREEAGMDLVFSAHTPGAAARGLFQKDREFVLRDGLKIDGWQYDAAPELPLFQNEDEFSERIHFMKEISAQFDEPPAVQIEAPLGSEPDHGAWRSLLLFCGQAGIARIDLVPGGGARALKNIIRLYQNHLEGYPLFEHADTLK